MLLLALALAAATPTRFDLDCAGPASAAPVAPYRYRYVIDLTTGTYCKGDETQACRTSGKIAGVTPVSITLQNTHEQGISIVESIDRETGVAVMLSRVGPVHETQSGNCKLAKFSGFPAAQF